MQTNVLFIVVGIWLVVLSAIVGWILFFFRKLSKTVDKGNLLKVLNKVLDSQLDTGKQLCW